MHLENRSTDLAKYKFGVTEIILCVVDDFTIVKVMFGYLLQISKVCIIHCIH